MTRRSSKNLVWLDLEMTGLDPEKEVIIEIASLVTDPQLNILEEGPCFAIHQNDGVLERMDEWNKTHHTASGLIDRVKKSKITISEAEYLTLEFVRKYVPPRTAVLCGNSIGHDRRFLIRYMKDLHNYFHYRNIDVTSIKELVRRWFPDGPKFPQKSRAHQASIDVRESLEELIFFRKHYFIDNGANLPALQTGDRLEDG